QIINYAIATMLIMWLYCLTIIQVMRLQSQHCCQFVRLLLPTTDVNRQPMMRLRSQYVRLFRAIKLLNLTVKEIIWINVALVKATIVPSFIFFVKQKDKSDLLINIVLLAFMSNFIAYQFVFVMLSYFPKQNLYLYKLLVGWLSKLYFNTCGAGRRKQPNQPKSTGMLSSRGWQSLRRLNHRIDARFWCRASFFTETIGRNQFGFTCSSIWFITK